MAWRSDGARGSNDSGALLGGVIVCSDAAMRNLVLVTTVHMLRFGGAWRRVA